MKCSSGGREKRYPWHQAVNDIQKEITKIVEKKRSQASHSQSGEGERKRGHLSLLALFLEVRWGPRGIFPGPFPSAQRMLEKRADLTARDEKSARKLQFKAGFEDVVQVSISRNQSKEKVSTIMRT